MKLFVPGRICLFGEHSDWAGGYRRINAELEKGMTLITGTNQGIFAEVKSHPSKLIIKTTLEHGHTEGPYEIPMQREVLLQEAQKGGFFSYAAGVAYQVLTHYCVRGLEIDNYKTDLPVKKGLSSSAAICVLVARAFNRIYDLKMTIRGEMEFAYMGEITTPSRCGRMDQGCAYGDRPVLMHFDGDHIDVEEINIPNELFFVIVDLHAGKNTKEILSKLNECYPFASSGLHEKVQEYLGPRNIGIVTEAVSALRKGDAEKIGQLMTKAQMEFDEYLTPACPSQLTAPVLHKLLKHKSIEPLILGGKGVGSQGDGSAQFIVRDAKSQAKLIEIIERDFDMSCLGLVLGASRKIRKAVIPAAGFGTRLFPASKAIKKELFPIIDQDGRAKPVILVILEEALSAGIEEFCLIVQEEDRALFEEFFNTPPSVHNWNKLSREDQKYFQSIMDIGSKISYVTQKTQDGFGHAVYCARDWVGEEPFLLMLGDHLYASDNDASCAQQLVDIYQLVGHSVVGLKVTESANIHQFGCVTGDWDRANSVLSITEFSEKPTLEYARDKLAVEGMEKDHFLTVFGQYVLSPAIFRILEENIRHNIRESGEFQLTSCLDRLRQEEGFSGYMVQGRRYDIGVPDAYRKTISDFP